MTISSFITAFLCSPQALQKIWLANHMHSLAELLHADAVQQLEVALLGTLAAKILDVLWWPPHLSLYAPLLLQTILSNYNTSFNFINDSGTPQVPIVGGTQVPVPEESPSTEVAVSKSGPLLSTSWDPKVIPSKCRRIIPTPIPTTSSSILNFPSIIVPKLVILMYALPEGINCPGGCKDYKCQIYMFQHTNSDCMLTHIQQHLEISVGCPMCGKGFQNVASLCKHGWKVHSINMVESEQE